MKGLGPYQKPTFLSLILVSFFSLQFGAKCYLNFFRTFLSLFFSLAGLWPPQLLVVSSWNIYRREQSWCTHPLQCPNYSYTPLIIPLLQSYIYFSQLFQTWCIHPLQCSNALCRFLFRKMSLAIFNLHVSFSLGSFVSDKNIWSIPDICHEPHEHIRVNFYRFNAKNWHFWQILHEKVAFFLQI